MYMAHLAMFIITEMIYVLQLREIGNSYVSEVC